MEPTEEEKKKFEQEHEERRQQNTLLIKQILDGMKGWTSERAKGVLKYILDDIDSLSTIN